MLKVIDEGTEGNGREEVEILREGGVAPINPRRAHVDDFALRIDQRATLLPSAGARAYGMLFGVTHTLRHRGRA